MLFLATSGEEYELRSASSCMFLHPSVTSNPVCPWTYIFSEGAREMPFLFKRYSHGAKRLRIEADVFYLL
jgi:hypothetical protein